MSWSYPKLTGTSPTAPTLALAKSPASVLRQLHATAANAVVPVREEEILGREPPSLSTST